MKESDRKKKSAVFMTNVVRPFFEEERQKVLPSQVNTKSEPVGLWCEHVLDLGGCGNYRSLLKDGFHELLESEVDSAHPYGPDDNGH